jgi:hypothetical protein
MVAKVVRLDKLKRVKQPNQQKTRSGTAKRRSIKWQYELYSAPASTPLIKIHNDLDQIGLAGWELVSIFALPDTNVFVFKKHRD